MSIEIVPFEKRWALVVNGHTMNTGTKEQMEDLARTFRPIAGASVKDEPRQAEMFGQKETVTP